MASGGWPVVTGIDAEAVGLAPGDVGTLNRLLHVVLRAPSTPEPTAG
jgi:hypothetical protein